MDLEVESSRTPVGNGMPYRRVLKKGGRQGERMALTSKEDGEEKRRLREGKDVTDS